MKRSAVLPVLSLSWFLPSRFLASCLAATPPASSPSIDSQSSQPLLPGSLIPPNQYFPLCPPSPAKYSTDSIFKYRVANLSNPYRYYVPQSTVALDFYEYKGMAVIARQDLLMAIIDGLSTVFGNLSTNIAPQEHTFKYQDRGVIYAFIHIQNYNPTPGREQTYGDITATLRGVAEWMTRENYFRALEFQMWSVTQQSVLKLGSGGVGGSRLLEGGLGNETNGDVSTS